MSDQPYTMKDEVARLFREAVPGQRLKRIKFNSFGGVAEVEWFEESVPAEAGTSSPMEGAEPVVARVTGAEPC